MIEYEQNFRGRRLKVLHLDSRYKWPKETWQHMVGEQIPPVFHRDGFYFDRHLQRTWIEVGGEAFRYSDPEFFRLELELSDGNNRIHPKLFEAIGTVLAYGHRDPKLQKIWMIEDYHRQLRKGRIPVHKRFYTFCRDHKLGRFKDKICQTTTS